MGSLADSIHECRVLKLEVEVNQEGSCKSVSEEVRNPELKDDMHSLEHGLPQFGQGRFHGRRHDEIGEIWKFKKLAFAIAQLHKNHSLDEESFAAVMMHGMPLLFEMVATCPDRIDWKLGCKVQCARAFLEDIRLLMMETTGLKEVALQVQAVSDGQALPSEAFLAVLSALDVMCHSEQVGFFKALYRSQQGRLAELFQKKMFAWLPSVPLIHQNVVCDSCSQGPIYGLRFNCEECLDYDLCTACFLKNEHVQGHGFNMIVCPAHARACFKGKGCGKGKAKGKGKGKGKDGCKGKGKGKFFDLLRHCLQAGGHCQDAKPNVLRPCAREGCPFQATWHPSHCCACCMAGTGENHGGRCERKLNHDLPATAATASDPAPGQASTTAQDTAAADASPYKEAPTESPAQGNDEQINTEEVEGRLNKVAKELEEMGLGHAEVLLELLRGNDGNVESLIENIGV